MNRGPRGSDALFLLAVVGGALAIAVGILSYYPIVIAGLALLLVVLATWNGRTSTLPRLFLIALGLLLLGYATLHRGFAHLGFRPVYVGEAVLALGVLATLLGGGIRPAFRSRLAWVLALFMLWGAVRTVPYLQPYGLSALRDAATWGYAAFAFLVAAFILRTGWFARTLKAYSRAVPVILVAVPVITVLTTIGVNVTAPDGVALLQFRGGPSAVHLAGAAAFLALGLHESTRRRTPLGLADWLLWAVWFIGFLIAATQNRGGMLAIFGALGVVLVLRPFSRWGRLGFVALLLSSVIIVSNVEIDRGKGGRWSAREITPEQIVENFKSILGGSTEQDNLADTRNWRLRWWEKIIDYTIFGEHFWTGKGFGVNLAISDGIHKTVSKDEPPLRSPHNGHLTVLARAGVPGFLLWIVLQAAFGIGLLRAYLRARATKQYGWAAVDIWILAYWIALNINGSFTVYLEGPHGGIWFWSLFGFGMAAMELQRPHRDEWYFQAPQDAYRKPAPAVRAST